MTDTPTDAGTEDHPNAEGAKRGSGTGMPRWVKVSLIVVGGLIVLFVVLQLAGVGGQHGPGRHMGPGSGETPSSSVGEHRPPPGMDHGR